MNSCELVEKSCEHVLIKLRSSLYPLQYHLFLFQVSSLLLLFVLIFSCHFSPSFLSSSLFSALYSFSYHQGRTSCFEGHRFLSKGRRENRYCWSHRVSQLFISQSVSQSDVRIIRQIHGQSDPISYSIME